MSGQRHVVVIERMAGHRIGERRLGRAGEFTAEIKAGLAGRAARAERLADDAGDRLADAGEHHRDAVGEADAHDVERRARQRLEAQLGDETAERPRQGGGHGVAPFGSDDGIVDARQRARRPSRKPVGS